MFIFIGMVCFKYLENHTRSFTGVCEKVLDGDTVIVSGKKIRLLGIDAPEKDQLSLDGWPIGIKSKEFLSSKILHKKVYVKYQGRGKYGRIIGEIFYNGININLEILKSGHGIREYTEKLSYYSAEFLARSKKIGMFGVDGLIRPSFFRKMMKKRASENLP